MNAEPWGVTKNRVKGQTLNGKGETELGARWSKSKQNIIKKECIRLCGNVQSLKCPKWVDGRKIKKLHKSRINAPLELITTKSTLPRVHEAGG